MSEVVDRLQRQLRAMGAMNRQLQAQLGGGGIGTWRSTSDQGDGDLLMTAGSSGFGASAAGARRAATAGSWLEQLAADTEEGTPHLVRRTNGRAYLIEGGYRREIRSGVIAAALEEKLGRPRRVKNSDFDRWTDGVPVEVLEGPQGAPFVVVGGRRLPLRGMPLPYPVSGEQMALLPQGPEINVGQANVSRARFREAMYGRYQMERVRSAIARKGVVGTAKEAARRATHRARPLARRSAK
jgi:hypothetical protein